MPILVLYALTVFIWGSTWFAIKFQLGLIAPELSIAYRFLIAALLLLGWCVLRAKNLRYRPVDHLWMAVQGGLLFSGNYYIFYLATQYLTSGLVAVAFSTIVGLNLFFAALFFKIPVQARVVGGAVLGLSGLVFVFWPEIAKLSLADQGARGLALALVATLVASLGNMTSAHNQRRGLPVLQSNAWGMTYGAAFSLLLALATGAPLAFDVGPAYVLSLLYLSVFGSVIAFGAYLTLLGRIGPGRAAYATVLFPVIALALSMAFEDYAWTPEALLGAALVLLGNVLVLGQPARLLALFTRPPRP